MATDSKDDESTQRAAANAGAGEAAESTAPPRPQQLLGRFSPVHLLSAALVAAVAGMVAAYVGFAMLLRRDR
jgi:hypothetical protein